MWHALCMPHEAWSGYKDRVLNSTWRAGTFANENGVYVGPDGQPVDREGAPIGPAGTTVDAEGFIVDPEGNKYLPDGGEFPAEDSLPEGAPEHPRSCLVLLTVPKRMLQQI